MKATIALILISVLTARADNIVSVDAAEGVITVEQKGALRTFRLKPFTDITINGQKATAAQLRTGMQASVGLADPQTASKITARGNFQLAATPPPNQKGGTPPPQKGGTPPPFFANRPSGNLTRKIIIKASIDATDRIIVQDGKLSIQHIDWSKPKDISINGIDWKPEWNDNKSDDFVGFNPPLAPFTGANVTVKKVKGQDVKIIEPPTEANGQKLVVHLQDNGSGASEFEVRITW